MSEVRPRTGLTVPSATAIGPAQPASAERLTNGLAAAAILAAGIGCLALGVLAAAGDWFPGIRGALTLWPPSGALSGVTTMAVAIWLIAWRVLSALWSDRDVNLTRVNLLAFAMLAGGFLLTFPPFVDLLGDL